MFGKVSLEISSKTDPIVIPNAAIQSDESGNRVFVVRGGKSTARAVELGISDGENTAVLSGIAVGDTVATVGANNLKDNSDVKVVPH